MANIVAANQTIRRQEILLEPIDEKHAALLFADLQSPDLYTYIPLDPPKSVEALQARYRRWSVRQSADGSEIWLNFVVTDVATGTSLGTVQATCFSDGSAMIAYDVFDGHRRRGVARRACSILIDALFRDHLVRIVFALVDTRNTASWRLLESLGFRRVQIIENADHFKGSQSDEFRYEFAKGDWISLGNAAVSDGE